MGGHSRKSVGGNHSMREDPVALMDLVCQRTLRLLRSTFGTVSKLTASDSMSSLRVMNEELVSKWSDYMRAFEDQEAALSAMASPELPAASQEFVQTHNKYIQHKLMIAQLMERFQRTETPADTVPPVTENVAVTFSSNFKMPPIRITPFDGNICDWKEFRATCDSVLTDRLPDVQRLQILKDALSGEPRSLISHIFPDKDAYKQAMQLLRDRYENNRAIINEHLKKFYAIPQILAPSAASFRSMLNTVNNLLAALKGCNINTDTWNSIVIFHLSQRFDKFTLEQWEEKLEGQRHIPDLRTILDFLQVRITVCDTTESFPVEKPVERSVKTHNKFQSNNKPPNDPRKPIEKPKLFYTIKSDYKCVFCAKNHLPSRCDALSRMAVRDTTVIVKRNNLCENCFYPHHVTACPFQPACKKCPQAHNTLLHPDDRQVFLNQIEADESRGPNQSDVDLQPEIQSNESSLDEREEFLNQLCDTYFYHVNESDSERALLSTAIVPARHNGRSVLLKALIDGGSTGNLITVNACRLLNLNYLRFKLPMTGVGGSPVGHVVGKIMIDIGSIHNKDYSLIVRALVVTSIGDVRGFDKQESMEWKHLVGLSLADPTYDEQGEIDMLLGSIAHADILLPGLKKGARHHPIATHTELGWLISGRMQVSKELATVCHNVNMPTGNNDDMETELCQQLKQFWEIEEVNFQRMLTPEEQLAEDVFVRSVQRAPDGKFVVDLPFQMDPKTHLGLSRDAAEKQYKGLQRRLNKNPQLKLSYDNVFEEYLSLKHMQLVDDSPAIQTFIPHHPVIKETSTTTKVRNVFNASMKTTNGVTLNQCLCVGPTIQPDLFDQVIQWRKYKIAISGDIEKMYRQIWVNPDHANHQTILWQRPGTNTIQEYRLMTVTFGTSSAPFQAVRSVYEVGERVKESNPSLAKTIQTNFYVDDYLKSFATIEEAHEVRHSITKTLAEYGFHLRKWKSNNVKALAGVDEADREVTVDFDSTFKTLGIAWNAHTDKFTFKSLKTEAPPKWTKRRVLSVIAKLFDPLGWLAPFVVKAKLFMQDIWRLPSGQNWDAELPQQMIAQWTSLFNELNSPVPITIDRWLGLFGETEQVELHMFCDAATVAYAAGVYLRVVASNGSITCKLIAAKTKVAPTKMMTIPRLELCGALLGAKLATRCLKALDFNHIRLFAWCDSKIVLAWLATHPSKWVTFVANRVSEIQENIHSRHWMHVPSKQNPADIASRGSSIDELQHSDLWWHGPKFLTSNQEKSPSQEFQLPISHAPDKRKMVKILHVVVEKENYVLQKCSDYDQLLRFTCYALRWIKKTKGTGKAYEPINAEELDAAETHWIKLVQREHFGHDIGRLKGKQTLPQSSKLLKLTPFVDDHGVLRMNGRVGNAEFSEHKIAIILPSDSPFVTLLIRRVHETQVLHGGVQITLRALRSRFWILHMRRQVQKLIHRCITCYRTKKTLLTQRMAELPSFRTRQAKPFTFVGTDYAGYFEIKTSERKNAPTTKAYIVLFMCLTTKAMHLELACDLSSAEYIMALENFIARRGIPNAIWSDNATNYVGAEKEIHALLDQWSNQTTDLSRLFATKRIEFKHIPARASHMAGIWERAVAQVKYHLKRVMKDTKLTARRFDHVLKQIECCLNSRPLWALTPNADDVEVLTPSHFFNFESINTLPRPNLDHIPMNRLDQYQYLYRLYTEFWKCWSKEYLHELQPRKKWSQEKPNVRVGQVVVISDDNMPPSRWPIGKIVAVYPGKDNLVRTVDVLCHGKTLSRPIHRLGILPIVDNDKLSMPGTEMLNGGEDVTAN